MDGKVLAHRYQTLQKWNHWLSQHFLGASILEEERKLLSGLLAQSYGKHALLIGVPHQSVLFQSTGLPTRTLMSPFMGAGITENFIESDFQELPILTGSIDIVLLPHTLEFVDNPRQLLAEACRIIKPEGIIAICGFNPYSFWGLRKLLAPSHAVPWGANFLHASKIKSWLQLADFAFEQQKSTLYRPPIRHANVYQNLQFLERLGKFFPQLGGAYVLIARAKVIPLTPIRMKWKQEQKDIRISSAVSGHIAHQASNEKS